MNQNKIQKGSMEVYPSVHESASELTLDENYGEDDSGNEFYEELYEHDEEFLDNNERKRLSNLTDNQLKTLIRENQKIVENSKDIVALITQKIEKLKEDQCKVLWTPKKVEELENLETHLREEEAHLNELKKRVLFLKSVKTKHIPFPVTKLPQVVLCTPWNDKFMPMVVVCNKPQKPKDEELSLDKKFLDCLTPAQFDIIEKEQRYMALECGELEIQIAGIKGKTKILKKENNVLTAMVYQDSPNDKNVNLALPGAKREMSCRRKGSAKKFGSCPAFNRKDKYDIPLMEITVTTSMPKLDGWGGESICFDEESKEIEEEIKYIKSTADDLQKALNEAKELDTTLKSQRDALKCLKEAIH